MSVHTVCIVAHARTPYFTHTNIPFHMRVTNICETGKSASSIIFVIAKSTMNADFISNSTSLSYHVIFIDLHIAM